MNVSELPANSRGWRRPLGLTCFGDEIVAADKGGVLLAPSVLAPRENNCLINPIHPEFGRIVAWDLEPLTYDTRMFEKTYSPLTEEILSRV